MWEVAKYRWREVRKNGCGANVRMEVNSDDEQRSGLKLRKWAVGGEGGNERICGIPAKS
jgi:hypothetical protein